MFLMNNRPYLPLGGETPYHKINGDTHPFFRSRRIPIFGEHVWVARIDPPTFGPKALEAIFLGVGWPCGQKAYRVQVAGAANGSLVYWSRNVYFEKKTASRAANDDDDDSDSEAPAAGGDGKQRFEDLDKSEERSRRRRQAAPESAPSLSAIGTVTFAASVLLPPAEGVPVILATKINRERLSGMGEEWAGFQRQNTVGKLVKPTDDMKILKDALASIGVKTIPFLREYGPSYSALPKWDLVAIFFVLATPIGTQPIYVCQPPCFKSTARRSTPTS
ncbi:hypothetical protein JCM3770_002398 [Rhodotorula araucariae]